MLRRKEQKTAAEQGETPEKSPYPAFSQKKIPVL